MQEIKMTVNGKAYTFQVHHEDKVTETIFLECREKPEMRGFYTKGFIDKNKLA